jgi:ATP synthase protein I
VRQDWKILGTHGTVGLELALSVLLPLALGVWLDKHFGTSPWCTLVCVGYGVAAGGRAVWRALQRANREADQDRPPGPGTPL